MSLRPDDLLSAPGRRLTLGLMAVAPLSLLGCGGGGADTTTTTTTTSTDTGSGTDSNGGTCSVIPGETAGPYPGDGSNSNGSGVANALLLSGIVRSDIRSSIDGASGTAAGVPLTVVLKLVNTNGACAGLAGYAVYLWHCDRDGQYSMYSTAIASENYLRGVQVADANGEVRFTTIFPGCYSGRWPHIHFEVYASPADATGNGPIVKTSQIALPKEACEKVYATDGYSASAQNLGSTSLTADMVFGDDGGIHQLASMSGDATGGYTAALTIGV